MLEPRPAKVSPPKDEQPLLRVGIILKEDRKPFFKFSVQSEGYFISSGDQSFELTPNSLYFAHTSGSHLVIQDENTQCFESGTAPISIIPPKKLSTDLFSFHGGITIDSITVGRCFHWRKDVVLTFPGSIEIYGDGEHLVVVNQVPFEEYISCVISSEMGVSCPPEFIKAQAVAARSWALAFLSHKHEGTPFTICNDDDCQRYQGTTYLTPSIVNAVKNCCGEFLVTEDGLICPAYYSKSCGGCSEDPRGMFGFDVPGIHSVLDLEHSPGRPSPALSSEEGFKLWLKCSHPQHGWIYCSSASITERTITKYLGAVDDKGSYYRWECTITANDIIANLRDKFGLSNAVELIDLISGPRGASGRILDMSVRYLNDSGGTASHILSDQYEIRRALHKSFLLSSAFVMSFKKDQAGKILSVSFQGCGWGHGVGLCQIGAVARALQGQDYKQILAQYYPDTTIVKSYTSQS